MKPYYDDGQVTMYQGDRTHPIGGVVMAKPVAEKPAWAPESERVQRVTAIWANAWRRHLQELAEQQRREA